MSCWVSLISSENPCGHRAPKLGNYHLDSANLCGTTLVCGQSDSSEPAALERANEIYVSNGDLSAGLINIPLIKPIKKGMLVNYVDRGGSKKSMKIISVRR
jgi:hypothetical protein